MSILLALHYSTAATEHRKQCLSSQLSITLLLLQSTGNNVYPLSCPLLYCCYRSQETMSILLAVHYSTAATDHRKQCLSHQMSITQLLLQRTRNNVFPISCPLSQLLLQSTRKNVSPNSCPLLYCCYRAQETMSLLLDVHFSTAATEDKKQCLPYQLSIKSTAATEHKKKCLSYQLSICQLLLQNLRKNVPPISCPLLYCCYKPQETNVSSISCTFLNCCYRAQ